MLNGLLKKPGIQIWVSGLLLWTVMIASAIGQEIRSVVGDGTFGFAGDGGQATLSNIADPVGVFVDSVGNIYIADTNNRRIRKIDTAGVITTVAGNGNFGFAGDGGQASDASLADPTDIFVDGQGNILVADTNNQRIRKIDGSGVITTIVGDGNAGFLGDGGQASDARVNFPTGLFVDTAGNIFFADRENHRIRKVDNSGVITTVAGNGVFGSSGDGGQATSANLAFPSGVFVDDSGNVFIADRFNHKIRKVDGSGVITTVAGNGAFGFSGDGGQAISANLAFPSDVYVDLGGNIYIADRDNHRIRKVSASGVITTVAGDGTPTYGGDNGPAAVANLNRPSGIWGNDQSAVWVADTSNRRIRKIAAPLYVSSPASGLGGVTSALPSDEVPIFRIGLTGDGVTTLTQIQLTLSDLSSATGLVAGDFSELRLYASADSSFGGGDTLIGTLTTVPIGSVATVTPTGTVTPASETEQFYFVTVVFTSQAVDGHAFRLGFDAGGVVTSLSNFGQSIAANDNDRVSVDVVATRLLFHTMPSGSVSGQILATQPVVQAVNGSGHLDLDFSELVTLTLSQGAGGLSQASVVAVNGVATFTNATYTASIDGEVVVLNANDQDGIGTDLALTLADSFTSNVLATQLVFTTSPAGSISGQILSTQPVVVAQDAFGMTDTDFADILTLSESSAGALSNASVQAVSGVATFTNTLYTASVDGESFTIVADDAISGVEGNLLSVSATPLNSDVVATRLVFSVQPFGSVSGTLLNVQPVVTALDDSGRVDTDFSETVTIALSQGAGSITHNSLPAVNGVAAFTQLTYTANTDREDFIFQANDNDAVGSNLPIVTANVLSSDIVATQLVFDVAPSGSVSGQPFVVQPIVVARDSLGGLDTDFSDTITLTEDGVGALSHASVQAVNGVAAFSNLIYTTTVDGAPFNIVADDEVGGGEGDLSSIQVGPLTSDIAATRLVFSIQPAGSISGLPLSTQPMIIALDDSGRVDANFTERITLTVSQGAGRVYNAAVQAVNGVATFANLIYVAEADGESFVLRADDENGVGSDLPQLASVSLTSDILATRLIFENQPSGSVSGKPLNGQPIVKAVNDSGQIDTDFSDLVTLSEGGSGTLNQASVLAVSGVATFTKVIYTTSVDGESIALQADDLSGGVEGDLGAVQSNTFLNDIVATRLVFTSLPSGSLSGKPLTGQPIVTALDDSGHVDVGFSEQVTLTLKQGNGRLYHGFVVANNGVATFSNLIYVSSADGEVFTLEVNDEDGVGSNLPSVSATDLVCDIKATRLIFDTQPSGSVSGIALSQQPVVMAVNDSGQVDANFSDLVRLSENKIGVLHNREAVAVNGVAAFTQVIYAASTDGESVILTADDDVGGQEGDLGVVTANVFVSDVVATHLQFTRQPSGSVSGQALLVQPIVTALNDSGLVDRDFTETITLSTDAGTLTNHTGVAVEGVVSFTNVIVSATLDRQTFTLRADDELGGVEGDLPALDASPVVSDVVATELIYLVQPSGSVSGQALTTQPVVVAVDANGLIDINFSETILLRVDGVGSLSQASVSAVAGIATFSQLVYEVDGQVQPFRLLASGGDLPSVLSQSISSRVIATQLVFSVQPAGSVSGFPLLVQPIVEARDSLGQIDRGFSETLTLTTTGLGGITGQTAVAQNGRAVFSELVYVATNDQEVFRLVVDDDSGGEEGDLPARTSETVISDVVATRFVFVQQPAGVINGKALAIQPQVAAVDSLGAVDTGFSEQVTLSTAGNGVLLNDAAPSVNGIATFSALAYLAEADGETLVLTVDDEVGGLDLVPQDSQVLTADVVATRLIFTTQPSGSISGRPFLVQPEIAAVDSVGLVDKDFSELVNLTTQAPGVLTNLAISLIDGVGKSSALTFTASQDHQLVSLIANDVVGGQDLELVHSDSFVCDVVASSLTFGALPQRVDNGRIFSIQPVVKAVDRGVVDVDFNDVLVLTSDGQGRLKSEVVAAVEGVAVFEGVAYEARHDQESVRLIVDDSPQGIEGDLREGLSLPFVTEVTATHLVFQTMPSGIISGRLFLAQPVVVAVDSLGVIDSDFKGKINLGTNAGGQLLNPSLDAADGVARFTEVSYVASSGLENFVISANVEGGDLQPAFSELLTAGSGPAHHLGIFRTDSALIADGVASQILTIRVLDENGNPNLDDTATRISLLVQGAATGGGTMVANAGEVEFDVVSKIKTGTVYLQVSADGLIGAVDSFHTVAGDVSRLVVVFDSQPLLANGVSTRDVRVQLRDANDNLRIQDNNTLVALGVSGVGAVGGGTKAVNGGEAIFEVRAGNEPGVIQLRANAGGLPETTAGIIVGAVKPNLLITQPPKGPGSIAKGQSYNFDLQVQNVGLDTVRSAFDISIKLVGGADSIEVGQAVVSTPVAPDSILDISIPFSVPSFSFASLASDFHWVAIVDAGGFVNEDDETDNVSRGNAVAFPELSLSNLLIDFGTVIPDSMFEEVILIENRGRAELQFRVTLPDSQLLVAELPNNQGTLQPGANRLLKIQLRPRTVGAFQSQIILETNDFKGDVGLDVVARVAAPDRISFDFDVSSGNQNLRSIETGRDKTVDLELYLTNLPPLQAMSIDLEYNPEFLSYETDSWKLGGYFVGGVAVSEEAVLADGKLRLSGGSVGNQSVSPDLPFGMLRFSTPPALPLDDTELATQISAIQIKFVRQAGGRDSLQLYTLADVIFKTQAVWPDLDGDGQVVFADFLIFVSAFRKDETSLGWDVELPDKPFPFTPFKRFDIDGDGQVGFFDFVTYAQDFTNAQP